METLAAAIEDALNPIVGLVMARVTVDLESKRLGKTPETLSREDLPEFADNVAQQLRLVLGEDVANAAAARVRELA